MKMLDETVSQLFLFLEKGLSRTALLVYPRNSARLGFKFVGSDLAISNSCFGFSSRKFITAENNYNTFSGVLLRIYSAIRYDPKPFTIDFKRTREARHLDYVDQFTMNIQYVVGRNNIIADTLSRVEAARVPIHYGAHVRTQFIDSKVQQLLKDHSGLRLVIKKIPGIHSKFIAPLPPEEIDYSSYQHSEKSHSHTCMECCM